MCTRNVRLRACPRWARCNQPCASRIPLDPRVQFPQQACGAQRAGCATLTATATGKARWGRAVRPTGACETRGVSVPLHRLGQRSTRIAGDLRGRRSGKGAKRTRCTGAIRHSGPSLFVLRAQVRAMLVEAGAWNAGESASFFRFLGDVFGNVFGREEIQYFRTNLLPPGENRG